MKRKIYMAIAAAMLGTAAMLAKGDVSGSVYNKTSALPIDYATVTLIDAMTGEPLQLSALTSEAGEFTLQGVPQGRYLLRVSNNGSVMQEREITVGDAPVNVGRIEMADDARMLEEVTVTGQRAALSLEPDKKVYNVSSDVTSGGATAMDLLSAIPSVSVSADGDIALRGNTDVLVWIDGKEAHMTADNRAQFLRQLPAEGIASIEVMANPSARHSAEGTAGIINIRLKDDHRHGYFGSVEADVDNHGSTGLNASVTYNEGKFETVAAIGMKYSRYRSGMLSHRDYADGATLFSDGHYRKHDNSIFMRLASTYRPDHANAFYVSAIGTLGHKHTNSTTTHLSQGGALLSPSLTSAVSQKADARGANILLGYRHEFGEEHELEMNVSYNIWRGPDKALIHEMEGAPVTGGAWQQQKQDVKISNWVAAADYRLPVSDAVTLHAGYKGNYNHENSPASYWGGPLPSQLEPLPALYNRFVYDTDVTALYAGIEGQSGPFTYEATLRGEAWQTRTRSLESGQTDSQVPMYKKNDFSLFPSASIGYALNPEAELRLAYSRRIHRPFGPQLNTFENLSDPAEVHLGNPLIEPEYSNAVDLTYTLRTKRHMLVATAYVRANSHMISHVSFLAPMAADPAQNTMYYGHANVGNMTNYGLELMSRNNLWRILTLTTTLTGGYAHLKGWQTDYPLHDALYAISGRRQSRFVWDARCMVSVALPWSLTLQATPAVTSRRVTAQGYLHSNFNLDAGLRKALGRWSVALIAKDVFNSSRSTNTLIGNGYRQTISKWNVGRSLRLAVSFNFGKMHQGHDHDHDHEHGGMHNDVDTGGYGEEHTHNH